MSTVPSCLTCAHCKLPPSGSIHEGVCLAVLDPFNGEPMPVTFARQERHPAMIFTLPCGYTGRLWAAK